MKPGSFNHLRIVRMLLMFTLATGLLAPLGRAGRPESVGAASPVTPTQDGPAQPSDSRTFRNLQPIPIPDSGPASPYPSTINASGLNGVVSGVTLILNNITHPNPDDLDFMLESPSGRRIIFWSDGGGSNAMNNRSIGFADNGVILPDEGPIITSPYKPVNYAGGDPDTFPASAPPPPHGDPARGETFTLAFRGEDPTGTWKLYVVDDRPASSSSIASSGTIEGGWSLTVTTAEHVVTSLADSGPGTLRDVVTNAPPGATITFDPSLAGGTITLTSGEIVIDKSLTISGPGAEKLTISGNNTNRGFNIQGNPLFVNVSISGLSIANGNAGIFDGGAIRNDANLTISEVNFFDNNAPQNNGGAIFVSGDGRLIATNCAFFNNRSPAGGAICFVSGSPVPSTIDRCTFGGNVSGNGGAILSILGSQVTVSNSTFVGNTTPDGFGGGGLSVSNSDVTVTNCTFSGNQGSIRGGGIRQEGTGTLTLINNTFTLNTAGEGGGLFVDSGSSANSVNTVFAQNTATTGPDISGQVNSRNGNFVGNNSGATITPQQPLDQFNAGNPQLTPLGDYGGSVLTHATFFSSPLINRSTSTGASQTDARNAFRINPDIGAFEFFPREDTSLSIINLGYRKENELFAKARLVAANQERTPLGGRITARITSIGANTVQITAVTDLNGEAIVLIPISPDTIGTLTLFGEYKGDTGFNPTFSAVQAGVRFNFLLPSSSASPDGGGCRFLIYSPDESFAANDGTGTINVRTFPFDCNWTATSNDPWIQITSGASGTGDGSVTYTVSSHSATTPRSGSITVAGITYNVLQGAAFLDVPQSNPFYTFIGKLSARGVTQGCGGGNYCPGQTVSREQMAAFIMRARREFNPPTPPTQRFQDVPPTNPFYNFIDRLAVLRITQGCSALPPLYCPSANVTREQMAAFMIRGLDKPNPTVPFEQRFVDVPPSNPFSPFIEEFFIRGITQGCAVGPPRRYCPADPVTREQMAAFLVRAFTL